MTQAINKEMSKGTNTAIKEWIIFTDLDGSLLDHDSYSHKAADALLLELEKDDIPVVLTTSKTRAEVLSIRADLNNHHPFIIENGAAIFIPQGYFPKKPKGCVDVDGFWVSSFCQSRSHWLSILEKAKTRFPHSFSHFSAMKEEVIAQITGLSIEQAEQANQREFGEPISWLGVDKAKQQFILWLESEGGHVLQGGRFLHLSGACNKGQALDWLTTEYKKQRDLSATKTIAIGDSDNDIAMLEQADLALIIRSPAHEPPTLTRVNGFFISEEFGPRGWNSGLRNILYLKDKIK
jgi:mannosyl-3-phosphoglycerate phosphatase family protein